MRGGRWVVEPAKKWQTKEPITFTEKDAQKVQLSHNDVVVVTLNIAGYDVRCILIDNESSIDILFYDVFSKISIPDSRMGPLSSPLVVFTGDAILVEGIITLATMAG